MGENSKIEWTDHTFNAWIGCTKVGPPCDYCYAEGMAKRYGWVTWGPHGERKRTSEGYWRQPLRWAKEARVNGTRPRVFCCSLADWLDNHAPQQWRIDLADLIERTPELDWLLLTKRIQNYQRLAPWTVAPHNVWLGITCGDQGEYERDWPKLAAIGARVRFVSYEPALGPLRIQCMALVLDRPLAMFPDWIICGGESGSKARYMEPGWAASVRDQCKLVGVSFFMKQMTKKAPIPPDLLVREFPTATQFSRGPL